MPILLPIFMALLHVLASPASADPSPSRVDLTPRQSPVRAQGRRATCVSFTIVAAMEAELGGTVDLSEESAVAATTRQRYPAELAFLESDAETATLTEGLAGAAAEGVLAEAAWPYGEAPGADLEGPRWRPTGWTSFRRREIVELRALEDALVRGHPVIVMMSLAFDARAAAATGRAVDVEDDAKPWEHHALLLVGYDREARELTFKNSWGTRWGRAGYLTLSYDYFRRFATDAAVLHGVGSGPVSPAPATTPALARTPPPAQGAGLLGME